MKSIIKIARRRSRRRIRSLVVFRFPRLNPGHTGLTRVFNAPNPVTTGEVIVSQRPVPGTFTTPVVRYQIVDAATGRPITNALTITGTRTVVLPFRVPPGTDRLRVTNAGTGPVRVQGVILVF